MLSDSIIVPHEQQNSIILALDGSVVAFNENVGLSSTPQKLYGAGRSDGNPPILFGGTGDSVKEAGEENDDADGAGRSDGQPPIRFGGTVDSEEEMEEEKDDANDGEDDLDDESPGQLRRQSPLSKF